MTKPPKAPRPVTQQWVHSLALMQQTVLLTAIRGPDGIGKYHTSKYLLRWFRRCVLLSAMDGAVLDNPAHTGGGSFTGPSYEARIRPVGEEWYEAMDRVVDEYLRTLDGLPHHFQMHFMHAAEILGYKHPDLTIRTWWRNVYWRLVNDLHLHCETEEELDKRLGDNRDQWLARNDKATVD